MIIMMIILNTNEGQGAWDERKSHSAWDKELRAWSRAYSVPFSLVVLVELVGLVSLVGLD